jgi:hypothetical protein
MNGTSAACAECRAHIGGYVLDALEPHEADAVRNHLAECRECAAEHARLADVPALLAAVGAEEETAAERPPAALEEAVLDRFAREHRAAGAAASDERARQRRRGLRGSGLLRPLRRPLPAAAAGALTAAAVAAALVAFVGSGDKGEHGKTYGARLTGSAVEPKAHAYAKLETSTSGTRVRMHVEGLRGNPDDIYELWCVRDNGTKISAGTFRVDPRGEATVNLTTAAVPGEYHRMSVERKADAPGPGDLVMAGSIQY